MDYILVSFRSRTDCSSFKELLSISGYKASLIPTPKEAGVGCGLSVKIFSSDIMGIKAVLKKRNYASFTGIFTVSIRGGNSFVKIVN